MAQVTINPALTSNAAGTFGVTWDGATQGTAHPDPAARFALSGGILSSAETLPMWGGVGISEAIPTPQGSPPTTPSPSLGGIITRATNVSGGSNAGNLTGFSVFNQGYGAINSPQSQVPLQYSGGQVMFYRLGSGARIFVAIDPVLVDLYGDPITEQVSWDFAQQRLAPFGAAWNAQSVSSASYTSATGQLELTFATAPFGTGAGAGVGLDITIEGMTPTSLNGTWTVLSSASAGTVVTVQATPGLGSLSPTGGSLVAGGGAVPVKVLKVLPNNCMTVVFDTATGFANWNRNGAAALILI